LKEKQKKLYFSEQFVPFCLDVHPQLDSKEVFAAKEKAFEQQQEHRRKRRKEKNWNIKRRTE
jgi:hypothetical protein